MASESKYKSTQITFGAELCQDQSNFIMFDLVQGIYYQLIETNIWFQMNKILAEICLLCFYPV